MKRKLVLILGCVLFASGVAAALFSQIWGRQNGANAREAAQQLLSRMPQTTRGLPHTRQNTAMPVLQLEGMDYVAVLEVPRFDKVLPVANQWNSGELRRQPCRYYGSAWDNTLVIGGSDGKGQLDFITRIDVGTQVFVTDMTGARFAYRVREVERAKKADADTLLAEDGLTLFARNSYGLEYVILRCAPETGE